ncbi:MAG: ComEC/Rec2 family competence protein [Thermodesulfobacteriota bacterium]
MAGSPDGRKDQTTGPVARPLIPVTLALMAGLSSAAWGLHLPGFWLLLGLLGLGLALALTWWRGRPVRLLPLMLFWLLGVAFYQQAEQPFFPSHHLVHLPLDENLVLLGHLDRPGKSGPDRVQLLVEVESRLSPAGWRSAVGKLLVTAPKLATPLVGTSLVLKGRLTVPQILNNPGAFNRPRHLAAEGIFRQVRLRDRNDLVFLASGPALPWGERLRGGIRQLLETVPPVPRAIYLAMLLGDQGEITPEMRRAFSRTGTSHLLVISGLHLSMVALVTFFLGFWGLRRFPWLLLRVNAMKLATLLASAAVVAYAWVAGGSPATQRAEIMVLAYLLLLFLGRPREVWSALALAALVILTLNPLRLFSISFQLSFVAVAALIYFLPRWFGKRPEAAPSGSRLARTGGWLWWRGKEALAASAVASLATAPLVAAYFQVVSVLGILVNLIAVPLFLLVALPLGEAAVLAQSLSLTTPAQWLLTLGQFPLRLGYGAIAKAALLPGSAIILPTPTWLQIALYYLLMVCLFPWRRSQWTWAGALLAGVALTATVALPRLASPRALEVTCLDHYGGLSGLVVTPEQQRLVFSAGRDSWPGRQGGGFGPLPPYLHGRQFRRLDEVLALRLNQENAPELLNLAQQFTVRDFWFGGPGGQGPAVVELRNYLGDQGYPARSLERGRPPQRLGKVELAWPRLGGGKGVALQLSYEGRVVLIIPPVSQAAARRLAAVPAPPPEVLIIPGNLLAPRLVPLPSKVLVVYGPFDPAALAGMPPGLPCFFTREGAVSLYYTGEGVTPRQWRPH